MLSEFPTPQPAPIDKVSPSLANQLLSCPLRVAFSRDTELRVWRKPSTHTELGLVAHAVTEASFKKNDWPQDPTDFRSELTNIWERELAKGVEHLTKAWAPAIPPQPEEWPGYALTKTRTIRRAIKLRSAPPSAPKHDQAPGTGIEIALSDAQSGLFGRADRIEQHGESTRVVDLKTGLNQEEPSDEQQRQLLLYAVLVERTTGSWPGSVAVEDASGNVYERPLDPAQAESALSETLTAVERFNNAVVKDSLVAEASPSPDRCRWCDFRSICGPFWASVRNTWDQRSAMGSIIETGGDGLARFVRINVEQPSDRAGTTVHIAGLTSNIPADATHAAVVDWVGAPELAEVRARWSTKIRTWQQEERWQESSASSNVPSEEPSSTSL
jgi:RecB family exonuclease